MDRASTRAAPPRRDSVGAPIVSCEVSGVGINVQTGAKSFDLPKQINDVKQELERQELSGQQQQRQQEYAADVDLKAKVAIKSESANDVAHTVETTQRFFQLAVSEIQALHGQQIRRLDKEATLLRYAGEFQNQVQELLSAQGSKRTLNRQQSSLFMQDMQKAETLLKEGSSAAYVQAVRQLLSTGENITVALKDLSYIDHSPKSANKASTGPPTLVTAAADALCAPVRKVLSLVRRDAPEKHGYTSLNSSTTGHILRDVNVLLKPGRLTLVLGPPGSSKSSFLKAISGQLFNAPGKAELTGKLLYNGYDVSKLRNPAAWVSYVPQTDEHQPLLTTRETLEFAWKCRREPIFNKYPKEPKYETLKQVEIDIILATLGLANCKDTYIGNATLKGVSGGEKRRVTLGEKLVTGTPVLALDEISTGLDSAATFDIIAHLASVCHILGHTIVVALLQPPPEVIDLFDDIICLAQGQVIYHGEREKVLEHFQTIGYSIPERVELGDFLQAIPTKDGLKYFTKPNATPPRSATELAQLWRTSPMYKQEEQELNTAIGVQGTSLDDSPQLGFIDSLLLVARFTMRLRLREHAQVAAKVFSNVVMGSFFGSLFWQLDSAESYLKSMLLFQAPSFVFSTAFPTVQVTCKQKPVFIKQLDARFYTPAAFTFAQFLTSLPFILFDILCFGNIVYFCTGLAQDVTAYTNFLLLLLTYAVAVNAAFSIFPFVAAKEDSSVMLAACFLLMCLLNAGLVATPDIIPPAAIWLFWMDPLAWVLRALSINEYHSGGPYDVSPCKFSVLGREITVQEPCGDYFLEMRQIRKEDYWIPACHLFMLVFAMISLAAQVYVVGNVRFEEERSERVQPAEIKDDDVEAQVQSQNSRGADARRPLLMRQDSVPIPRQQLCVRELWYTVNVHGEDVAFLKGVTFHTYPGRSLALMGSSGAGKTTLMDVIAGRKTVGKWRGEILIDGKPKVQSEFVKYAAYVEQFGSHFPSATVLESLQFSAALRLPTSYTVTQKANFIQEQLEILELEDLQHAACAGLSMEQNKRVTLGVELVANPSIVFADEPTSSLDARAAAFVMRVLNRIAASGRTVICTIHQPSAEVFLSFDDLLLLKRGGEIAYFGPLGKNAKNLIDYFEAIPGTVPCPSNANPGTWMLEVLGAGTTSAHTSVDEEGNALDFAAFYRRSALRKANDAELAEILSVSRESLLASLTSPAISKLREMDTFVQKAYVRSQFVQFYYIVQRSFRAYWRTPGFTLARYLVISLVTLLFAIIFWQQPLGNVADIQSRVILIYFFVMIMSMYNLYSVIPFAMARLPVFYRERATRMYSIVTHVAADGLVELPFILVEVGFACGILYSAVGMNPSADRVAFYFIVSLCVVYLLTMIGFLFASLLPDALSAQLSAIAFIQIMQIFSGVMVPKQNLPKFYQWLYYASPFKWSTESIVTTQFQGDDRLICAPFGIVPGPKEVVRKLGLCTSDGSGSLRKVSGVITTAEEFALGEFLSDFSYDNRWIDLAVILVWIVGARLLTTFTVRFINHNRR